jgi:hypothetical protein
MAIGERGRQRTGHNLTSESVFYLILRLVLGEVSARCCGCCRSLAGRRESRRLTRTIMSPSPTKREIHRHIVGENGVSEFPFVI